LENEIELLTNELKFTYIQTRDMTSRKKFAEALHCIPLNQILFALHSGKIMSIEEGISNINYDKLADEIRRRKTEEFDELFNNILKFECKKTNE
jgi:hypothetical protein